MFFCKLEIKLSHSDFDKILIFIDCYTNRPGAPTPVLYTEMLPGNQMLALIITSVTDTIAGTYYCEASYARTEQLETKVEIKTYGKGICFSSGCWFLYNFYLKVN